jgi:hypothetical protein
MKSENDPIREGADDAMLDELLGQARWADAKADSVARLKVAYLRAAGGSLRSSTQPRASARGSRRSLGAVMALAAMVAIALGVWWIVLLNHRASPQVAIEPKAAPIARPEQIEKIAPAQAEPLVRALNPAERLVLIADKQAAKAQAASKQDKPAADPLAPLRRLDNDSLTRLASATKEPTRRREAIGLILERNDLQSFLYFVLRPSTRDDALAVVHAMPNPPILALLAELNHQQVDYRLAAAKALGGLCDDAIDSTLMTMVRQNNRRREAIAALLSCSDPHAKQMLSQAQTYASADEIRSVQHDLNKTF